MMTSSRSAHPAATSRTARPNAASASSSAASPSPGSGAAARPQSIPEGPSEAGGREGRRDRLRGSCGACAELACAELADAELAIEIDPGYAKAYVRRAQVGVAGGSGSLRQSTPRPSPLPGPSPRPLPPPPAPPWHAQARQALGDYEAAIRDLEVVQREVDPEYPGTDPSCGGG